ncbi:MAG: Ppx/GppA family phosphatase [Rhodobacteraceae bacterium]|nr:Ppx/GppA family phosphatase [Paracoccaceae bacterium]
MSLQEISPKWGPFGRPIYKDDNSRSMARIGVIDIGSNSVRFVVFDGAARSPAYFYNEKIMCALGAGLSNTGKLSPSGRKRAMSAIIRFTALADGMGITPLTAVATAAVREAGDGAEFCDEVEAKTGLKIFVIDGEEEARLSAQGVLLGWPGSYGLVCDIGGSSMELADLANGQVGRRVTSALGPLKLREIKGGKKALKSHIKTTVKDLHKQMRDEVGMRLFLVGGSWRAIARIDMHRRGYPLTVMHEYRMTSRAISATRDYIEKADLEELRGKLSISHERMILVPWAAQVLGVLIKNFKPRDITVSSYGIREGMLYEQMPISLREKDPLIEACHFSEQKDARMPGFGPLLYDFVLPLFSRSGAQKKRIIRAACLLHDVSWRAHPDYRAEVCFDNTTRANLGGLKHEERIYMGLALLHRYSNKREGSRYEHLFALLPDKEVKEAEVLGRAMRLGAVLWLGAHSAPGELKWRPQKKLLELRLTKAAEPLFGEVVEGRFKSLASALGGCAKVIIGR